MNQAAMEEIRFNKQLVRTNGARRKSFDLFQIPKSIRDIHDIVDGLIFSVKIIANNKILRAGICKITSGGEIPLSSTIQKEMNTLTDDYVVFILASSNHEIENDFHQQVARAMSLSTGNRLSKIAKAPKSPSYSLVRRYDRSPIVAAEVLVKAEGVCGRCKSAGPFRRATDNSVYLEVHHISPLSAGGQDAPENCIALCPNCHREAHHGTAGLAFETDQISD